MGMRPFAANAQTKSYSFKHWSVEEGLSQPSVLSICQDRLGFMWFGTKDGLNRFDGHSFKVFRHNRTDPYSLGNHVVHALHEDARGMLWVGTDEGVYLYDPQLERFSRFQQATAEHVTIEQEVADIRSDHQGNLWVAVRLQGTFRYSISKNQLALVKSKPPQTSSFRVENASALCVDRNGTVWTGSATGQLQPFDPSTQALQPYASPAFLPSQEITAVLDEGKSLLVGTNNGGLKRFDKKTHTSIDLLPRDPRNHPLYIRDIASASSDKTVWLGTEAGLYIYDPRQGTYQQLVQNPEDPYALSDNVVHSLYQDREGGMWVGTYFGGVNYFPHQTTPFTKYYPLHKDESISGLRVREFCEDAEGYLWIGTEDAGLNRFNPRTQTFQYYQSGKGKNDITYHNIHGLAIDGDRLWIGTYSRGLDVMNLKTGQVKHYEKTDKAGSLGHNDVFSIYRDRRGHVWIGTLEGVYRYQPLTDDFAFVQPIGNRFIYDILEDHQGMLWLATRNEGAIRYDPFTGKTRSFRHNPADSTSLSHNVVMTLFEDHRQRLWLGTEGGGLCRYEDQMGTFVRYSTPQGFPSAVIHKILEDKAHNLWISTTNGLVRFQPDTQALQVYTKANGLLQNRFNQKSGFRASDGTLYFGNLTGFIAFRPGSFTANPFIPPVVLTGFQVFNQEVVAGFKDSPLQQSITHTQAVTLPYDQSTLSFTFAALSFTASENSQYAYQLEGLDRDWTYLKQNQKAAYAKLPPGEYLFRVKASNGNGKWNEKGVRLAIRIRPPFWQSPLAFGLYGIMFLVAAFYGIRSYRSRIEKRHRLSLEKLETQKEREIYNAKIEFFTHVAHEIRTPLTLIKGPLEHLLQNQLSAPEVKENLSVMDRNTNRLLELTNQLLDFRKMDQEGLHLNFMKMDVIVLLREIYLRFKSAAQQGGIAFVLDLPQEPLYAEVDHEALNKLFSNLFSNAVKHASSTIRVTLQPPAGQRSFVTKVSSDGSRIPANLTEKIFEPFFQIEDEAGHSAKNGSGLGLPLARSLAQLHEGELFLDSLDTEANTFVVVLPLSQKTAIRLDAGTADYEPTSGQTPAITRQSDGSGKHRPSLLVVEDNQELQHFLIGQLSPHYQVFSASHGLEALAVLDRESIGIVVSDIMMPQMNGFDLCEAIKSRIDYSHIPVVLLTAKNNLASRLEGLEMGADAYLEKPLSMQLLRTQVANLLKNREKIRTSFANSPLVSPQSMALTKADEQFLTKANELILQHLEDVSFGVDQLAEALHMSQSSLLRKIKGIAELTPNDFIRLVRLKRAAQLIEDGEHRINEITLMVGFNSASYFARCFQKQFGVLPKDFGKKV
jgi:ligand-binding sensor domain-containing protein/signal transduction histidine kinase/DNA-binding response OmpR family regulator